MTRGSVDLTGRVALVTGAAQGLGRAHSIALAARGASIVAVDVRDARAVVEAIEQGRGTATAVTADLSSPGECDTVVETALAVYGDLDIVVNNAGLVRDRMSFNLSREDWDAVLAVNLSATFLIAQAAIRHWRSAPARPGRTIVNTSSESGLYGNAGQANYAAAKAGVAALTVTLATELEGAGIRVNAIAPRARTAMSAAAFGDLPHGPGFDPFAAEHVAEVVAWLASDLAYGVTGQVLVAHGHGIEVMRPWTAARRLARAGAWSDVELEQLREALFPDGVTRQVAGPIGDLFVSQPTRRR